MKPRTLRQYGLDYDKVLWMVYEGIDGMYVEFDAFRETWNREVKRKVDSETEKARQVANRGRRVPTCIAQ